MLTSDTGVDICATSMPIASRLSRSHWFYAFFGFMSVHNLDVNVHRRDGAAGVTARAHTY